MTYLCFYINDGAYRGFTFEGHSGFANFGNDIVCAGVTAIVRLAECITSDILGLSPQVDVLPEGPEISMLLPREMPGDKAYAAQSLLAGMHRLASELSEEYPGHIRVEVKKRIYPGKASGNKPIKEG